MSEKIVKNIPKSEDGHSVIQRTVNGDIYHISHNTTTNKFTLWQVVNGGYVKIKTANNPYILYEKIEMLS